MAPTPEPTPVPDGIPAGSTRVQTYRGPVTGDELAYDIQITVYRLPGSTALAAVGAYDYAQPGKPSCTFSWRQTAASGAKVTFKERRTSGTCVDGISTTIRPEGGSMRYDVVRSRGITSLMAPVG